jgi:hypothetical protein
MSAEVLLGKPVDGMVLTDCTRWVRACAAKPIAGARWGCGHPRTAVEA